MTKLAQTTCPVCDLVMYGLRMDKHLIADNRRLKDKCPRCDFVGEFRITPTVESRPLGGPR